MTILKSKMDMLKMKTCALLAGGMLAIAFALQQTALAQTTPGTETDLPTEEPTPPANTVNCPGSLLHGRTIKVANAILNALQGITACDQVTANQLATITLLELEHQSLTMQSNDFAGLSGLQRLNLGNVQLTGHVVSFHRRKKLELDPSSNYQPHRHHHYSDGDGNCEVASPQAGGENRLIYAVDKRPQSTGKPSLKPQKNGRNRPARDSPLPFPMAQVAGQHQQRLHQRKQQGGNHNGRNHAKKKK